MGRNLTLGLAKLMFLFLLPPTFGQAASGPVSIVLDDWWNIDYVKNGCELAARNTTPCSQTPEETVGEFEAELRVAFASERACHGVTLLSFTPEMAQAAVTNPAGRASKEAAATLKAKWQLMLDLDGHSHTQVGRGWSISNLSTNAILHGRISTPERLAQRICRIAKGIGGAVE